MATDTSRYQAASLLLFLIFCMAMVPGLPGMYDDVMNCWAHWTKEIQRLGLANAYESGSNYPPLYLYVLWLYGKLATTPVAVDHYIGYLRVVALAADCWALWIVYKWTGRKISYPQLAVFAMLNIAYSYNTMIWHQVDAILAALVLACLYEAYRGKLLLSCMFMVLALNMKLQAIVFVPMWCLMLIASLRNREGRRGLLLGGCAAILTQALLILPFATGRGGTGAVWHVVIGLPGTYKKISMNAYNVWYWLVDKPADAPLDDAAWIGKLDYHTFGLAAFALALCVVLWPLMRSVWRQLTRGHNQVPAEAIWLTAALSSLVFFFFNTRMHERYSHPAFVFITALAFYKGRFGLYILFSAAVLLNMEGTFRWFRLPNYETIIFDPKFVAALFGGVIVWGCVLLYRLRGARGVALPARS